MNVLPRIIRSAVRANVRPTTLRITRQFHASTSQLASQLPNNEVDPLSDPTVRDFYDKIKRHQGAQDAMAKIGKLMESKGLDMSKPPSAMQMMKLGMDSELREAGMELMTQLKDAGIDINPGNAAAIMAKMRPQE